MNEFCSDTDFSATAEEVREERVADIITFEEVMVFYSNLRDYKTHFTFIDLLIEAGIGGRPDQNKSKATDC